MSYFRFYLSISFLLILHSMLIAQPAQFALYQNVPDPFDSSGTSIIYRISTPTFVNLWVEDTLSMLVKSLVSSQPDTGWHVVEWDARNQNGNLITPGNYYCKMTANTFRDSIIMHYQETLGITEDNLDKWTYNLQQNYPNPFNPSTTIKYQLGNDGFVSLKVFNALGEEVAELVNQFQKAGSYSVVFDATFCHSCESRNLPSGVYVYKITAGNYTESKKMILLQ